MKKLFTIFAVVLLAAAFIAPVSQSESWSLKADYSESCSCDVPCPCVFGSAPSKGHCDVNNFFEIEKGHYGDVTLDGIQMSMSSRLGQWARFYFSEGTTDEQAKAAIAIVRQDDVLGAYFPESVEVLSVENGALSIEKAEGSVKFSNPSSMVEIEVVKGLDDKPIRIENLGIRALTGHTQYKSVINKHKSDKMEFEYTGSNGLTSVIDVSGE